MKNKRGFYQICLTFSLFVLIIAVSAIAHAEFRVDSAYPTLGAMGQELEVILSGEGFDTNTRVSIYLDAANKSAIIGELDTPGNAKDVAVVGNTGYLADGDRGLQVIDVSNPANPMIIGTVDTPGTACGVAVNADRAYVADGDGGLQVIDVSISANPRIIGYLDTPGYAYGIAVVGQTAYVADGDAGLQVIDVKNPASLRIIGHKGTPDSARAVRVSADLAYVAVSYSGLQVMNISNPEVPWKVGSVDTQGRALGLAVLNNRVYVADSWQGLLVIDVGNPASPDIIHTVDTPSSAQAVKVITNTAYVADSYSGLQVIDLAETELGPKIIGSVDTPGSSCGLAVIATTAYVADDYGGLQVIDVSNPTNMQSIGSIDTPGDAHDIYVTGNFAYIADKSSLQIFDVSKTTNPQFVGTLETVEEMLGVQVLGTTAYVADAQGGLKVVDVSNPARPEVIGVKYTDDFAYSVQVVDDIAYVADGDSGLMLIDVSDPRNPRYTGAMYTGGSAWDVAVIGKTVYLAASSAGLFVIDATDPKIPMLLGAVDTPGYAYGVSVVGNIAYVADGPSGLQLINVSNPRFPSIIRTVDTPSSAKKVKVVDDIAYVADYDGGIQVIDVNNPFNPQIIGSVNTPGYAYDVRVETGLAYVADGNRGLVIVPLPKEVSRVTYKNENRISAQLTSPSIAGRYILRVFNNSEHDELFGAVTFTNELQVLSSKAIIVAGGGPNAPGEIWEETKLAANKAYDVLIHEGYDDGSIYYLTGEVGNPVRDYSANREELDYAINHWAADASQLVIFFVDHGLPDQFIVYASNGTTQQISVDELDDWLDSLQQVMAGPLTFIYDACHSGTFASKLIPPSGKDRIIITGASDEPAYFRGKDSFSYQFWEQILLRDGNLGYAYSGAAEVMRGYQSALINANNNSLTNEDEDSVIANSMIIRRGQPIYLNPPPSINSVVDAQILNDSSSAIIWVSDVQNADDVRAKIIPPDINPEIDGVPITDFPSITLPGPDLNGTYQATYTEFNTEGTYTIIITAHTYQEIYSYVQDAMVIQDIPSSPVYTSVTQLNGAHNIVPDELEDDDSYQQARIITLSDLDVQAHSFHDSGDVDWVKFYALSGQTYNVKASNVSVITDAVVELYDSNGITRLAGPQNDAADGEDETLSWTCTRDDIYFVKLSNANTTFGENCKYDLKLYRPIGPLAGFVVGSIKDAFNQQVLAEVRIKTDLNQTALSFANGDYLLVHPPGTFTITAEKTGYSSKDIENVVVNEGGETSQDIILNPIDTDNDGISDLVEGNVLCLDPNDDDTDNDGILDGNEDVDHDGVVDTGETDPCEEDTDGDGLQDGTEIGLTEAQGNDTDPGTFIPDADPNTTTDPLDDDTDDDGWLDGEEDTDLDGMVDPGEKDPNQFNAPCLPQLPLLLL